MPAPHTDHNLLFAVLVLQNDLAARDDVLAAMNAWAMQKHRSLGDLLVERGALGEDARKAITGLLDLHVAKHGSPEKSLAALDVSSPVRRTLVSIADSDVQASLGQLRVDATDETRAFHPNEEGLRYRILRPHARGGLGEVFVAEDTELHREVALKEIQPGRADHESSRGRFIMEAEVTGGLEHPGIVPVYGLGTYEDGRPFYAMRFIRGDNLARAVERFHESGEDFTSMTFRRLLGRFIDVCNAIAYAHSRGVLHRDLKPGNIMLGKFGETLVVDWGLAKVQGATNEVSLEGEPTLRLSSGSNWADTGHGAAIGTPAYMSPEQAAGRIDELGPASDVYGLGATLFTVLTGQRPVDGDDVGQVLQRVVNGEVQSIHKLKPEAPPALEAVCKKAMARLPADRYATPLLLAQELERWLADEPVAAFPEPWTTRLRRFARKKPALVSGSGAALAVAIVGLAIGLSVIANKNAALLDALENESDARRAESDAKNVALEQKEIAEKLVKQVEKGTEVIAAVFKDLDPQGEEKGGTPLRAQLGERLKQAAKDISGDAIGDPLVVARLQHRLGVAQQGLGLRNESAALLKTSTDALTRQLPRDDPERIRGLNKLSMALLYSDTPAAAEAPAKEAFELAKARYGPDDPSTLLIENDLGVVYAELHKPELAQPILEETLKKRRALRKDDPGHEDILVSTNNLAHAFARIGQTDRAIALYEESLKKTREKHGDDHVSTGLTANNLALAYKEVGDYGKAEPILKDVIDKLGRKFGRDHADVMVSINNLGIIYQNTDRYNEALAVHAEALGHRRKRLGDDHPDTLESLNNLAATHWALKQMDKAVPLLTELVERSGKTLGEHHPNRLLFMANLAVNLIGTGKLKEGHAWIDRTIAGLKTLSPEQFFAPEVATTRRVLSEALENTNRPGPLVELLAGELAMARKQLPAGSPPLGALLARYGAALLLADKPADAEPALRETLAIRQKHQPDHWSTFNTQSMLGESLSLQKKHQAAEPLLLGGHEGLKKREATIPPEVRASRLKDAAGRVAKMYRETGKVEEAKRWEGR
jgi:eukaryotic-like serine/threonine-protein kinase